ncbi:pentatricopeptide repeat-containing protein At3g50420-like [Aristolochia californica]|uniref:pentatricopeptide repeat-containing protein At3g50420-like n=1 Tax=Aristolochia californica TaxID=171875 RepID=UPI0035DE06B7
METAFSVFNMIDKPDLVSWNSIIAGCSNNGCGGEALNLFTQLQERSTERPDEYTFAAIVFATGARPALNYGKPLHAQVAKSGFEGSVFVCSTLIAMYFRNEEMESARKLFDSAADKDIILWTEMISGHLKMGDGESAIKYFCEMQKEHKVDSFALSSALSGAADLSALKQGEMIHCQAIKSGNGADMCVSGSLVDMYSKNGSLEAAEIVFSEVRNPDLKCWNSMLGGFCHHGKAEQAFKLFNDMFEQGLNPDHVTFVSLLSACSHCGLVARGNFYWNYMRYLGLEPGVKHYSCMVSLLSRAGFLQESEDLISSSAVGDKFPELWRNLLGSCVVHRELELGVRAAERVFFLMPEDTATHILLSNLYAATGRWDAMSEMRRKIRGLMTEKDPGLSWIQVFDQTFVFSAGYEPNPLLDEAQAELQRLRGNMEEWEGSEFFALS